MKRLTSLLLCLMLSATAFATNNMIYTRATGTKYEKVKRATVVVYHDEKEIPANAVKIGTIMCNVSRNLEKRLIEATNMAALNGGNGLYVLPNTGENTTDRKGGLRIAVYRTDGPARSIGVVEVAPDEFKVGDNVQWTHPRNAHIVEEGEVTQIWSKKLYIIKIARTGKEKRVDGRELKLITQ